jgi:hypothetical protein
MVVRPSGCWDHDWNPSGRSRLSARTARYCRALTAAAVTTGPDFSMPTRTARSPRLRSYSSRIRASRNTS